MEELESFENLDDFEEVDALQEMQEELKNFTLEQQFRIISFNKQVDQMNLEQARQMLKIVHQTYVTTEALCKSLLKPE
jgi:GTPase involved in cell partitioning and DNA repair